MPRSEIWPDAEQRTERRAAIHMKLDQWLDNYLDIDGDAPVVLPQHTNEAREIFDEILDLKFSRDCDGDRVIEWALADRTRERLGYALIPHDCAEDASEIERLDYYRKLMSAQRLFLSYATRCGDRFDTELSMKIAVLAKAETIEKLISDMTRLIRKGGENDGIEAQKIVYRLCGDPGDDFTNPLVKDEEQRGLILDTWAESGFAFVDMKIAASRRDVDSALANLEAAGADNRSIDGQVWLVLADAYKRFGRGVFREQIARFNQLGDLRRAARKAAKTHTE